MALELKPGIVKYNNREDIVCYYGEVNGVTYYFLTSPENKIYPYQNRIATTVLKEAVDPMFDASNIGLFDDDGNIIIPFDKRQIKAIDESLALVEPVQPTTPCVVDAIKNLKGNPESTVYTLSNIREKMRDRIGSGSFLFYNLFSEAGIYDVKTGENILPGLYSFIAVGNDNNDSVYLGTADGSIVEFSLSKRALVEENNEEEALDVSAVSEEVAPEAESINEALNSAVESVVEEPQESQTVVPVVASESEETIETEVKEPETQVEEVAEVKEPEAQTEEAVETEVEPPKVDFVDTTESEEVVKLNVSEAPEEEVEIDESQLPTEEVPSLENFMKQGGEPADNTIDPGDEEEFDLGDVAETTSLDSMVGGDDSTNFDEDIKANDAFGKVWADSIDLNSLSDDASDSGEDDILGSSVERIERFTKGLIETHKNDVQTIASLSTENSELKKRLARFEKALELQEARYKQQESQIKKYRGSIESFATELENAMSED